MRDQNDSRAVIGLFTQQFEHNVSHGAVKGTRSFVQNEDRTLDLQCPEQCQPLLLIKCFFDNKDQDYCINNAYKILFYGGEWYNYEDFKLQIKNLIKDKKSFLYLSEK